MLRASSEAEGLDVDLDAVLDADDASGGGVPAGAELGAFAAAVRYAAGHDDPALVAAREALAAAVGPDGLTEAAATAAVFHGLVRVADGTGIQLDDGVLVDSADYRDRLGLDDYAGAANSASKLEHLEGRSADRSDVLGLFSDYA